MSSNRILLLAVLGWLVIAVMIVVCNSPLGHDESAYVIMAQGADRWPYRSPGTIALALLGAQLGEQEWQLRLPALMANAFVVVVVYVLGRAAYNARTGAWAAAVVAGTVPMVMRSAEILGDLPALTCLLAALAIIVSELSREGGARWRVVTAAPLFACAFYVRYGSVPVIGIAIVLAHVVWWRDILRRPWPMLAMSFCLALALVPHLVTSRSVTGSWLGILELSSGTPRRSYFGEGLVSYVTSNPFTFYGALAAPLMVAALAGLVINWRTATRSTWFLAGISVGQIVVLGIHNHAQPRYVFVATSILIVIGVENACTFLRRSRHCLRISGGAVVIAWIAVAALAIPWTRKTIAARQPMVEAAAVLREVSPSRRCVVFAKAVTQLQWYSGCQVLLPRYAEAPLPSDVDGYVVSFTIHPVELAPILEMQRAKAELISTTGNETKVWRLVHLERPGL